MSALSVSPADLQRRVAEAVARLGLSRGATLSTLLEVVASTSGRTIEISPVGTKEWETVTGLVLLSEGRAQVLVRKSDPRWYQFHSVLHELSHLVLEHTGCSSLPSGRRTGVTPRAGQTMLARSVATCEFERHVDFLDEEAVREAEAEKLSQVIAELMLGPKYREDEAVLG